MASLPANGTETGSTAHSMMNGVNGTDSTAHVNGDTVQDDRAYVRGEPTHDPGAPNEATRERGFQTPPLPPSQFALGEFAIDDVRPMRVAVIGAGFSGLVAAIRLRQRVPHVEIVVYEKHAGVGGAWCVTQVHCA